MTSLSKRQRNERPRKCCRCLVNSTGLPKKLFQPLGGKGPNAGVALATEDFERARDAYYRLAGFDPSSGAPTRH